VNNLQVTGLVVLFLRHRSFQIPSPACTQQIGDTLRRSVDSSALAKDILWSGSRPPTALSMRQIEVSRTIVFTQPRYARAFTDVLILGGDQGASAGQVDGQVRCRAVR